MHTQSHGFHPQGHEFPPQDLPMEVFERHFDFEDHHYIAYFVAGVKKKTYKNYLRTLEYNGKKDGYFLVIESEAENNFLTEYMQKHKIAGVRMRGMLHVGCVRVCMRG